MKMTMHIDEVLLGRVMARHGLKTKTDAVHFALHELDRKARLREVMEAGLGLEPEELAAVVFEGYDPKHPRVVESGGSVPVAEPEPPHETERPG